MPCDSNNFREIKHNAGRGGTADATDLKADRSLSRNHLHTNDAGNVAENGSERQPSAGPPEQSPAPSPPASAAVSVPFALYKPPDIEEAANEWGANCGPASLAALAGIPLAQLHQFIDGFDSRGYMNPTHVRYACAKMHLAIDRTDSRWPDVRCVALLFIQWGGPWLRPSVPIGAAYRNTHWIALVHEAAYDVNVGHWIHRRDWCDPVNGVAAELMKHTPRCDGSWSVRTALHFDAATIVSWREQNADAPARAAGGKGKA